MKNVKILVPASLSFSSGVRDIAQEAAVIASFEQKQINLFRLVVDEIFMNAVRYGSDKDGHIFVEIAIDGEKIICAIEDEGKGPEKISAEALKEKIQEETHNVSLKKTHGRGLAQITSTLVQAFEILDKPEGGLRIEFMMEKQNVPTNNSSAPSRPTKKILPEIHVSLRGEIDLNNTYAIVEEVENILEKHKNEAFRITYDCSSLTYCNSSFLGKLAEWHDRIEANGGETLIKNPSADIYEILDLVGLTKIFLVEGVPSLPPEVPATAQQNDISAPFTNVD